VASLESPKKFLLDVSLEEKGQDRKTQKLLGGGCRPIRVLYFFLS
jgi:hypothetical protein